MQGFILMISVRSKPGMGCAYPYLAATGAALGPDQGAGTYF
jgi:hypothetical protein